MKVLTHKELEDLARSVGVPEDQLDIAAAIAQAESGGGESRGHPSLDPKAHKDSNGRWSIGLWQINSLTGPPPGEGRDGVSNDQLASAQHNAEAMAKISGKGTNWKPWGAFKNGSFKRFLTRGGEVEIISRQSWGAAPPKNAIGRISGSVGKLFLHHTVTRSGPADQEHSLMREIQKIAFSRGFSDISYSFIVFPSGHVYEGRGWGKAGAHTQGHNSTSYAISLAGNYENEPMTDAQLQAARGVIAEGQRLGHIAANFNIQGHREVKATACPGKNAFARIHEIRTPGQINGGGIDPNAFPLGPNEVFKKGMSGSDVCRIQERLRAHGHGVDRVNGCPFGPQTERAVTDFQRRMNLGVDGKVGKNTWRALFA